MTGKSPWQLPSSKDPLTWNAVDLSNVQFHKLPPSLLSAVPHLLAFVDHRILPKNEHLLLRCDYKEFFELAKLFLGAVLSRQLTQSQLSWQKKVRLLAPGSSSVKCSSESSLHPSKTQPSKISSSSYPLQKFKKFPGKLSKKVVTKTSAILLHNTWYLSEELIPIALF